MEEPGFQLIPVWDTSAAGGGLMCYIVGLPLNFLIFKVGTIKDSPLKSFERQGSLPKDHGKYV